MRQRIVQRLGAQVLADGGHNPLGANHVPWSGACTIRWVGGLIASQGDLADGPTEGQLDAVFRSAGDDSRLDDLGDRL